MGKSIVIRNADFSANKVGVMSEWVDYTTTFITVYNVQQYTL